MTHRPWASVPLLLPAGHPYCVVSLWDRKKVYPCWCVPLSSFARWLGFWHKEVEGGGGREIASGWGPLLSLCWNDRAPACCWWWDLPHVRYVSMCLLAADCGNSHLENINGEVFFGFHSLFAHICRSRQLNEPDITGICFRPLWLILCGVSTMAVARIWTVSWWCRSNGQCYSAEAFLTQTVIITPSLARSLATVSAPCLRGIVCSMSVQASAFAWEK